MCRIRFTCEIEQSCHTMRLLEIVGVSQCCSFPENILNNSCGRVNIFVRRDLEFMLTSLWLHLN